MSKFSGRRGVLGLAKESSRGTPVNPTHFVPWATASFMERTVTQREEQALGVLADSDSNYVTLKTGEGEFEAELYDKALGLILTSLLGSSPSTDGGDPYTHTYTLSNSNQHQSLALYWEDPDRQRMFPLAVVNSLSLTVDPEGKAQWTVGFMSRVGDDWTAQTEDFSSLGSKWLHQHLEFRLASNIAGLSGASNISLKNLELNITANTAFDSVTGTVEPEDVLNQQFSVDGSISLNFQDDTYRDLMLDGTYQSMEVKLNGGSSSILTLQMPRVDFTEWEPDYTLNEIATQSIQFKGNYDKANSQDIISTATLVNSDDGSNY